MRVDGEADINSLLGEDVVQLANLMLRLRYRHAIAGDDDHFVRGGEDCGGFLGGGAVHRPSFRAARCCGLHLAEGSKQYVGKRAVHGLRHDDRKNESGRSIERAGDDEELVLEDESHGSGGQSGIAIGWEMTVGISAPPIGMMSITPKTTAMPTISGNNCFASGCNTR